MTNNLNNLIPLDMLCSRLGISIATGKNWIKLGKIKPSEIISNKVYFNEKDCKNLIKKLKNNKNTYLKSRRNKNFKSGFGLYKSYILQSSNNYSQAEKLIDYIEKESINISKNEIEELLAFYSQVILRKYYPNDFDKYKYLSEAITKTDKIFKKEPKLKEFEFIYEKNEDILGLLYLSLSSIQTRKSQGAYYTPTEVVNKLIKTTFENYKEGTIIDPCCGSGNFILNLPDNIHAKNVYAGDIDELSIKIAKINFALKYGIYDKKFLNEHIKTQNFLTKKITKKYDYIIGNPPWAYIFDKRTKDILRENYKTAKGTNIESYDVITEKALKTLNKDGILSFVLPEAVLNVKSHKTLREVIIKTNSLKYIEYLGDTFDGVQCPSIIIKIIHNNKPFETIGLVIKNDNSQFTVNTKRGVTPEIFSFTCNDKEYEILSKIENIPNKITLKNNSQFALGIVTGNNKKYLSKFKNKNNEFILKGSDIKKYLINTPKNCIIFNQKDFQQCANEKLYRAKEKLLYKFISKKLVFAYDNSQFLTLNSCNILIPQIKGLDIKYILGILNSKIAQFYFEKKFKSLKVLRSHIEQIPIPYVEKEKQKPIIDLVDKILSRKGNYDILSKKIDNNCCLLYGIKEDEL